MTSLITEKLVELDVPNGDRDEIIAHMANLIHEADRLHDYAGYYANVLDREATSSTGIGFGIAIPHGKCEHVKETTIAFGRLKEPVEWGSLDGNKVNLVFLLAVPEACKGDQHLRIIASLSRKLIHEEFRDQLTNVTSEAEIVALLEVLNDSLISAG